MQLIRKHLTYANVVSSLALFLVLAGATAFAASHLGKNSVGSKQLKKNSVTAAKIKSDAITGSKVKDQSLTGPDINVSTLGTVPSATSAKTADSLAGGTSFKAFTGPGLATLATFGPFTVKGKCEFNKGGRDIAELQLYASAANSSMDDNSGNEFEVFGPADGAAQLLEADINAGNPDIEAGSGELTVVAPDGTTYGAQNQTVGENMPGHAGQCFFAMAITKIG